jgi:hypothetical protein
LAHIERGTPYRIGLKQPRTEIMDESERAEDEGRRSRELWVGTRGDIRGKDEERILRKSEGPGGVDAAYISMLERGRAAHQAEYDRTLV